MARRASKKPAFFMVITPGFNTDDLRIPPEFRKYMMNELSERATLEVCSSKCSWTVQVSQIEGDIYFRNGWQEFIRDNSLGDFEFLVFRYERAMHFSIQIFDKTACMRDNFLENSTVANTTNRPRGRPRKCKHSAAGKNIPSCQSTELKEIKEGEEDYQDSEEEAATLPKSEFPSFTSIIGAGSYNVFRQTSQGYYYIVLKNSEGRKWKVNVVPNSPTVKLSGGWGKFKRANRINFGDTCIFELVKKNTMVVHIIPK
ncbi:hypothetical protein M0R45_024337 [Rubus argutus]|uniref:TF-B3 domain-containing protein n=1 Tax=Rubus argutus TaxID=59490 RepID=A0AAW1WUR9_RUBAR